MFYWVLVCCVGALFAFVDVWYFVRGLLLIRKLRWGAGSGQKTPSKEALFKEYNCHGIVLPSDLDLWLHMNNSKYLREMDFARMGWGMETGVYRARKSGAVIVLNAASIRYRRSLQLFQRFVIKTRLLCWEDDAFYLEQKISTGDGFVCAITLAKMAVRGLPFPSILERVLGERGVESPSPSAEVASWMESIRHSSAALKSTTVVHADCN